MGKVIALVGNPNCGKTTLFNRLTGSTAHVGNWPGVTVELRRGKYRDGVKIVDLPGNYSLDPFSPEEKAATDCISQGSIDVIINIVDATCLERSLYLTTQLLEKSTPVVIALNMMDEAKRRGIKINVERVSVALGAAVIPISAVSDSDFDTLINTALEMRHNRFAPIPRGRTYSETAAARYRFIEERVMPNVTIPKTKTLTERLDRILLNRLFALPVFAVIMAVVFALVFGKVGNALKDSASFLISCMANAVTGLLLKLGMTEGGFAHSLISDGIFGGVGEVLSFLPQILLLFMLISLLEASGYMARAAFITDRILGHFSLTGKSVVPLLMGFGCSVPAMMSARTVESRSQRRLTVAMIPFMSCSAKLPVFVVLSSAVLGGKWFAAVGFMYLLGVFCAMCTGAVASSVVLKGAHRCFVLELPEYRLPTERNLWSTLKEKASHFLTKAGTLILISTVALWLMRETGLLAKIGTAMSPIFAPLGFGSADMSISALSGFIAKEMVVSTMSMLSGGSIPAGELTTASMLSFLSFCLLSPPCVASCATLFGEMKSVKLSLGVIIYYLLNAWLVSFLVYHLALLIL